VDFGAGITPDAVDGLPFPRHGACVLGEFCLGNGDVGSLFSNETEPVLIIDDIVFFGATTAPWRPKNGQGYVGGNASGDDYLDYLGLEFAGNSAREVSARARLGSALPFLPPATIAAFVQAGTHALEASLTPAGQPITPRPPLPALLGQASMASSTPLNLYQGALGDKGTFGQAPFDVNRSEQSLSFDCLDNAHPWCFVREAFFQVDWRDTSIRVGRQQIVWGKTDAFRLQDIVNPIDIGYHNVFPDLEERRIPMLALDVIHSFGDVGPVEDVSLELAWVVEQFLPLQFGQCGEPYAYTLACQGRADAAAHGLFNFALAQVDEKDWGIENTEPGMRLEWRLPEPSISFSLSFFYGFQDLPVGKFVNPYSTENPNPAALLFLQGQGLGPLVEQIAAQPGTGWSTGFDPWDQAEVQAVSDVLATAWQNAFTPGGLCDVLLGGVAGCLGSLGAIALPWTASEVVLQNPRVWTLGGSLDYQLPGWDTILRMELAYDVDRAINDTSEPDGVDESGVFLAAIGIDRPTYFRFLNPTRTALLSFQTFFEHVMSYDPGSGRGDGMVVYENQFISTFLHEHYWRNDSLVLRNFFAYDWNARAFLLGPSFKWVVNNNISIQVGLNFLLGDHESVHNVRDLCPGGGLETASCTVRDPTTWQPGQWQALNRDFARTAQAPFFSRQGFGDRFQAHRDELWIGFTYQF
jgi:hypothetical protein